MHASMYLCVCINVGRCVHVSFIEVLCNAVLICATLIRVYEVGTLVYYIMGLLIHMDAVHSFQTMYSFLQNKKTLESRSTQSVSRN